jgi:hypothetical protein
LVSAFAFTPAAIIGDAYSAPADLDSAGNGSSNAARATVVPRLALSQEEAAEALGVSTSFFVE